MKIKTKFAINALFMMLFVLLVGVVEQIQYHAERANAAKQSLASQLASDVYDLNFITYDFLNSPSERSYEQWRLKFTSLSKTLAEARLLIGDEGRLLNRVEDHFETTSRIFETLSELSSPKLPHLNGANDLRERLEAQLLMSSRSLYGESLQLRQQLADDVHQASRQERFWQFSGFLFFALLSIGTMVVVSRSLFPRLRSLQHAFAELAEGHLGYRLKEHKNDELDSLAKSFNTTVERLSEITVSRTCLEEEITVRRASQGRLEQAEKALAETADSVFMFFADNRQVFYVNKGATTRLGENKSSLLGREAQTLFPQLDELITGDLTKNTSWSSLEMEHKTFAGEVIHLEASLQFITACGADESDYYILIARDISERKAFERQQVAMNQELERRVKERTAELELTNRELEAFSYSISHDLRAPLRAINGQAGMLEEELAPDLSEQSRHHLKAIRHNSLQMGELVDDLLAYSRLSKGASNFAQVDLEALTQSCWEETLQRTGAHEIDFQLHSLPPCQGDAVMLKQVMLNLLSNAVKYSTGKGSVCIEVDSTRKDETDIYFVRDNGVGFDMRYADKLFDVFHRLHTGEEYEGTGIGLSLAKRIIERHNGRIWAEGEINTGATFFFTLNEVNTR